MNRRTVLKSTMAAGLVGSQTLELLAGQNLPDIKPVIENNVAWFNVEDWGVEGKGWVETKKYFDRLPAKAEGEVRGAVWNLSRHSAGMMVQFQSDSAAIHVRYQLSSPGLDMVHMPATGVSGVDLYADNGQGEMRWVNVSRPTSQKVNARLVAGLDALPDKKPRAFQLYLPLYNGVDKLEIGVSAKSRFKAVGPRTENRIVFYGTSIMHGACASRPGMSISAIVGRRLNRPVINLGFSGNGKMEKEVGALINELNPDILAIDCLPNMNAQQVKERTEPLVHQVRQAHPETPILLVEDRSFTNSPFFKARRNHHAASRKELRAAYERLGKAKVKGLYYLGGDDLLGTDGEGATDGSHPNDLGMMRYADAYEQAIKKILG